jgi:hypothetical protein
MRHTEGMKTFLASIFSLFCCSMACFGFNSYILSKSSDFWTSSDPNVSSTPLPPKVWIGQFTYNDGRPPFHGTLRVDKLAQDGTFSGTLTEPEVDNGIVSVNGQIGKGDLSKFNATDQSRLQHAIQLYGAGIIYIAFTDPAHLQGTAIVLNCHYYAVIDVKGTLHGIWYYPPSIHPLSIQPDGKYLLNV